MKNFCILKCITSLFLIMLADTLIARNLESLIDELESQLLPVETENNQNSNSSEGTIYSGTTKISGTPRNTKIYNQIENALDAIDKELDQLDLSVALEKEKMERNSQLQSFVKVSITLPGSTEIRDLTISINNQKLFFTELIQPISDVSYTLPIFDGPMAPGKYRFDIQANVSSTENSTNLKKWQVLQDSKRTTLTSNSKKEAWKFQMKKVPGRNEFQVNLKTEQLTLPNRQATNIQ